MKNLNKDSEDVKEGDLEKRKIKSVLGGSRGISSCNKPGTSYKKITKT